MLATFFTITDGNISTMLGYVGDLIADIQPLLLAIIGVGLGLVILGAIVGIFKH